MMEIVIKIPKEFEEHFKSDRFEDSLQRVRFDIHKSIISNKKVLSGKYEIETLDMLTEAFLNGTPLPKGHGKLKDADELYNIFKENCDAYNIDNLSFISDMNMNFDLAPTIIEAEGESDNNDNK